MMWMLWQPLTEDVTASSTVVSNNLTVGLPIEAEGIFMPLSKASLKTPFFLDGLMTDQ